MSVKDKIKEIFSTHFSKIENEKVDNIILSVIKQENKKDVYSKYFKGRYVKDHFLELTNLIYRSYLVSKKEKIEDFAIIVGCNEIDKVPKGARKVDTLEYLKFKGFKFVVHKEKNWYVVSEYTTGMKIASRFNESDAKKEALFQLKRSYDLLESAIQNKLKINN